MKDVIDPINTSDGLFHDGDQSTGALGTIVTAKFQNDVQVALQNTQSEIIKIIKTSNPLVVLDPSKTDQLFTALKSLFLQTGNNLGEIKNAGAVAVSAALSNLGLGDAAKLGVGSSAQMAAGTSTALLPTIAAVMGLFSKRTFSTNDYIRIPDVPGGLMIQWGGSTTGPSGSIAVGFPVTFPNGVLVTVACPRGSSGGNATSITQGVNASGFNVFTVSGPSGTAGISNSLAFQWLAVGF